MRPCVSYQVIWDSKCFYYWGVRGNFLSKLLNFKKSLFCGIKLKKKISINLIINAFPVPIFGSKWQAMLVVVDAHVAIAPVHAVGVLLPLLSGWVTCKIETIDSNWSEIERYTDTETQLIH